MLDEMQVIETAIIQAGEIQKRGDHAGAWETVEKVFQEHPEDSKLNQLRANLTTEAADFVRTLRTAEQLEQKEQTGSSLAWFLRAQNLSRERVRAERHHAPGEAGVAGAVGGGPDWERQLQSPGVACSEQSSFVNRTQLGKDRRSNAVGVTSLHRLWASKNAAHALS